MIDKTSENIKTNLAYPKEIAEWTEEEKERQRINAVLAQKKINSSIENGEKSIVLKTENYRFANDFIDRLKIYNAKDLTIDFSGSTIWIENRGMGCLRGIEVMNSENCLIKNLFLDYDPMPYFQGTIESIDEEEQSIDIKIDEGFYFPDEEWLGISGSQMKTIFFDKNGEMLRISMNWVALKNGITVLDEETVRIKFRLDNLFRDPNFSELSQKAYRIVIPWRRNVGVKIVDCSNVTFEDMTIYADPGTGIYEMYGEGGTVLRRLNMVRRPETQRMLVSNADAIHMLGTKKAMRIENSRVEYAGDDLVNSNAFYAHILEVKSPLEIIVATMYDYKIEVSEELRFIGIEDWEDLGTAKAAEVEEIENDKVSEQLSKLREDIMEKLGLTIRGERPNERAFLIKLSCELPLKEYALTELGGSATGFVAKDSSFKGSIANGIRVRTAKTLIEGCNIKACNEAGVLLGGSSFWSEGAYMFEVTVRNNTFEGNSKSFFSETSGELVMVNEPGGENRNINNNIQSSGFDISKNKFINPTKKAVLLSNVKNACVSDNEIIFEDSSRTISAEDEGAICLGAVKSVSCKNNTVKNKPKGFESVIKVSEHAKQVSNC